MGSSTAVQKRDGEASGKLPGFYLYPADLERELAPLPPMAQVIWVRMFLHMHWSPVRGKLIHETGASYSTKDVARLTAIPVHVVQRNLDLMEHTYGVFSRDENGCIYNRRMVRDAELSGKRKEAGKKGGNPILVNQTSNQKPSKTADPRARVMRAPVSAAASTSKNRLENNTAAAANGVEGKNPPQPAAAGNGNTEKSSYPAFIAEDWPKTDAAITEFFPDADNAMRQRIVEEAGRSYVNVNTRNGHTLTDHVLADAIKQGYKPKKQYSAGLFLKTVPVIIENWVRDAQRGESK